MALVLASILLLIVGPLLSHSLRHRQRFLIWLDRLTFLAIASVLFVHVIPESVEQGGWLAVGLIVLGFGLPTLAEHALHKAAETVHIATLAVGMLGLVAHGLLDGLSLTQSSAALSHGLLPALVLLHRLPVGQLIWALLRPSFGRGVASAVIVAVSLATFAGYFVGHQIQYLLHGVVFSLFQALVAGAIMHVVLFRSHVHKHHHHHEHSEEQAAQTSHTH